LCYTINQRLKSPGSNVCLAGIGKSGVVEAEFHTFQRSNLKRFGKQEKTAPSFEMRQRSELNAKREEKKRKGKRERERE